MSGPPPNQFHGQTYSYQMTPEDWRACWQQDRTGFHLSQPHSVLQEYLEKVIAGREQLKFLIPLCGKAVDITWLARMGHIVVGVEFAEEAVLDFFKENQLDYKTKKVDSVKATLYKSIDGKIRIYCGNFYDFNSSAEGRMNAIWDRGSLVAIPKTSQTLYVKVMKELMADDCRYLVQSFEYDESQFAGPPYCVPQADIKAMYGDECCIEHLRTGEFLTEKMKEAGVGPLDNNIDLITRKTARSN